MEYLQTIALTPDELFKTVKIFSHPTTTDEKLVDYAVNMNSDFMDACIKDGTLAQDNFDALQEVCKAVPVLLQKTEAAHEGKKARLKREKAKAANTAAYLARACTRCHGLEQRTC
jgi:hypothetical protein